MPEHSESLKRDFIEDALSLTESFAGQAHRAIERGEKEAANLAKRNAEWFCQQAWDMIQRLESRKEAEAFTARLRIFQQGLENRRAAP